MKDIKDQYNAALNYLNKSIQMSHPIFSFNNEKPIRLIWQIFTLIRLKNYFVGNTQEALKDSKIHFLQINTS